jgi:hypothetical protein
MRNGTADTGITTLTDPSPVILPCLQHESESDFMRQIVNTFPSPCLLFRRYYFAKRRTIYRTSSTFDGGDREDKGFREEN